MSGKEPASAIYKLWMQAEKPNRVLLRAWDANLRTLQAPPFASVPHLISALQSHIPGLDPKKMEEAAQKLAAGEPYEIHLVPLTPDQIGFLLLQ